MSMKFFTPSFNKLKGREKKGFRKLNSKNRFKYFKIYMSSSRLSKQSARLKRNILELSQKLNRKKINTEYEAKWLKILWIREVEQAHTLIEKPSLAWKVKVEKSKVIPAPMPVHPSLKFRRSARRGRCPRNWLHTSNPQF